MDITLNHDFDSGSDVIDAYFQKAVLDKGYVVIRTKTWATDAEEITEPSLSSYKNGSFGYWNIALEGLGLANVYVGYGSCTTQVAANSIEDATAIFERIKLLVPENTPTDPDTVPVEFWTNTSNGPMSITRNLKVPEWKDIKENYAESVQRGLSKIFEDKDWRPGQSGQLLLWLGEAGTGKTTALRALAREWKEWCELHYIVDTETFFSGSGSNYMMRVLLGEDDPEKWRIIVLEDAGELLAKDAKQSVGQALSRFLNIVDGLIGQGLNIMILVTSNEEVGQLHEAVARPGRAAVKIKFKPLNSNEVMAWMERHDLDPKMRQSTLAELYALTDDFEVIDEMHEKNSSSNGIGFGF